MNTKDTLYIYALMGMNEAKRSYQGKATVTGRKDLGHVAGRYYTRTWLVNTQRITEIKPCRTGGYLYRTFKYKETATTLTIEHPTTWQPYATK